MFHIREILTLKNKICRWNQGLRFFTRIYAFVYLIIIMYKLLTEEGSRLNGIQPNYYFAYTL